MDSALFLQMQNGIFQKGTAEKRRHRNKTPLVPLPSCGKSTDQSGVSVLIPKVWPAGPGTKSLVSMEVRDLMEPTSPVYPPWDSDMHTQPRMVGTPTGSLSWWPRTRQMPRPLDVPD